MNIFGVVKQKGSGKEGSEMVKEGVKCLGIQIICNLKCSITTPSRLKIG